MREKGDKALSSLRHLLAQKRLPMDGKQSMYTALVRSVQENACGVWTTESKQPRSLESVQNKATAWILRTNSRTGEKTRVTILGLPSLEERRRMLRVLYLGTLLSKRKCFENNPNNPNKRNVQREDAKPVV